MDNEDLLNDLNEDFGSEEEEEEVVEVELKEENDNGGSSDDLSELLEAQQPSLSSEGSLKGPLELSRVYSKRLKLYEMMGQKSSLNAMQLSKLQPIVLEEMGLLQKLMAKIYERRFPELQSLMTSPKGYAQVVKHLETSDINEENLRGLEDIISKEHFLVLSMAMHTGFKQDVPLTAEDSRLVIQTADVLLELCDIRDKIEGYVASLVSDVAPNLCILVGSQIAASLIAVAGGLSELSEIPSCNLSSIGKAKNSSHTSDTDASGVRQKGYIYQSDLVSGQPMSFQKQALRMVCAKVSLCARADRSKSCPSGALGAKWKEQVLDKLRKLQDPPNISNTKALPIPEDKPKKKRAGRRFRKYKEQFQLSHTRQLQNRMEFGKQENTTFDAFGEEIGMGMAHTLRAPTTVSRNRAKMRKSMQQRLLSESQGTQDFLTTDDRSNILGNTSTALPSSPVTSTQKLKSSDTDWYRKYMQDEK